MSADNGIYILVTKGVVGTALYEYRVVEAGAIENIFAEDKHFDAKIGWNTQQIKNYFGKCQVFFDDFTPMKYAFNIEKETGWTEYGINYLSQFKEYPFPK
jgi:hypothetical protein